MSKGNNVTISIYGLLAMAAVTVKVTTCQIINDDVLGQYEEENHIDHHQLYKLPD